MATFSEVKAGLDEIAQVIRAQKLIMATVSQQAQGASDALGVLPTDYADVVSTIQAYGTTNAAEANAKAELAKLVAEYQALKTKADAVVAAA